MSALFVAALLALGGSPDPVSYWREVRPLLQARCAGCHQPAKAKGGVVLTDARSMLLAAEPGHAAPVIAGAPDTSELVLSVSPFEGAPPSMPAEGAPLTEAEVALLRRWIAEGAADDSPPSEGPEVSPEHPPVYTQPPVLTSLAWSPDGALLAVSGYHEVLLLDSADQHVRARLVGLSERIESLAFSPDGARLAVAGGSPARLGEVQVWDVATAKLLVATTATHDCLYGVSWSGDGRLVAFGAADKAVRAIDAVTGALVLFNGAHDDWVLGTAFSIDGSHVVSVSRDRSMKLIQVASQQFIDDITSITPGAQKGGLMALARHPARDEVLIGGADGVPRLYRTFRERARQIGDDYNLLRAFEPMPGRVFAVGFQPSGALIAAGSSSGGAGTIHVHDAADGTLRWRHTARGGVFAVGFSPDGAVLAAGGFAGEVTLLDAATGEVRRSFVPVPLVSTEGSTERTE